MAAKILAFAGSNRKGSWNRVVLEVAAEGARRAGAEVTVISLADYPMPIYDADWHAENGVPESVLKLRALLDQSQGLLIASPEYNSSITPLLKNTLDWLSKSGDPNPYIGKTGALLGATAGGFGTIRSLPHVSTILSNLGVLMLPVQAVPRVNEAFEAGGAVKDEKVGQMIAGLGMRLAQITARLAG